VGDVLLAAHAEPVCVCLFVCLVPIYYHKEKAAVKPYLSKTAANGLSTRLF